MKPAERGITLRSTIDWDTLVAVVTKAILDANFRKELGKDPEKATRHADLELSRDQLDTLKRLSPEEWDGLSLKDLDSRLSAIRDFEKLWWILIR